MAKIMMITTIELRTNSLRDGHDTLFISASTAIRKSAKAGMLTSAIGRPTVRRLPTATGRPITDRSRPRLVP